MPYPLLIPLKKELQRLCALAVCSGAGLGVAGGAGEIELIEALDGVPRHRIEIPTHSEDEAAIRLDGRVDEPVWARVSHYDNMLVAIPGTGEPGTYPSEIRLFATPKALYLSAVLRQPPETLVTRLTQRDNFIDRDTLTFTFDPSGEGLFAYWFTVALGGSVADGKVLPERRYSRDWDGTWRSATAQLPDGWSLEAMFPWSMLSLPPAKGPRKMGFATNRQVSHMNERYQWPGFPYSSARFVTALNHMGVQGVAARPHLSAIPFVSLVRDRARNNDRQRLGVDVRWRPSPKLELNATALPDFGAVEADSVVLNLTALETFFPEKRLFFLEGNEIFETHPRSNGGYNSRSASNNNFATTARQIWRNEFVPTPISLMNTRRMGGTATQIDVPDELTLQRGESDLPTKMLGAAKLTGALGGFRYGLIGAVEDDVQWLAERDGEATELRAPGRDFAVARLLYEPPGASRKSIGYLGTRVDGPLYNAEVHGLDAHYTSRGGKVAAELQLLRSDVRGTAGYGALADLRYAPSARIQHQFEFDLFDRDANINDLGFLARNDYVGGQYILQYASPNGLPRLPGSSDWRGALTLRHRVNLSEGQTVESGLFWRNSLVLPGRNVLATALAWMPSRYEDRDSLGNGAYRVRERWWGDVQISTDASRPLSLSASIGVLRENLGDWTLETAAGATWRPNDNMTVDLDVRAKRRRGWAVYAGNRNFGTYNGPDLQPRLRFNWVMARGHTLRLSMQWAGVKARLKEFWEIPSGDGKLVPLGTAGRDDFSVSLLTAQARYRWSIAPLTDLFVVYNLGNALPSQPDSSFSNLFGDAFSDPVFESFVLKLRYRFGN